MVFYCIKLIKMAIYWLHCFFVKHTFKYSTYLIICSAAVDNLYYNLSICIHNFRGWLCESRWVTSRFQIRVFRIISCHSNTYYSLYRWHHPLDILLLLSDSDYFCNWKSWLWGFRLYFLKLGPIFVGPVLITHSIRSIIRWAFSYSFPTRIPSCH